VLSQFCCKDIIEKDVKSAIKKINILLPNWSVFPIQCDSLNYHDVSLICCSTILVNNINAGDGEITSLTNPFKI